MSDLDEIRKRLDRLREFNQEQNKQNVTDDQLQAKLRRLKGLDSSDGVSDQKTNYFVPAKFKSDVEATDDLFKQLCDEVDVDSKFSDRYGAVGTNPARADDQLVANLASMPADERFDASLSSNFVSRPYDRTDEEHRKVMSQEELEKELGLIKNKMREFNYEYKDFSKNKNPAGKTNSKTNHFGEQLDNLQTDSSDDDEANYIDLVRKFVDEAKLETTGSRTEEDAPRDSSTKEKSSGDRPLETDKRVNDRPNVPNEPEEEKLDFCYICSEDAVLVCIDCDRERFCVQCFKEFHDDLEYRKHR